MKTSLEKTTTSISPRLTNLIAEANFTLENAKEKILAVYNYAVQNDGFTPIEARKLIKEKVVNVTDRYIREVLPEEARETKFTPKRRNSNVELVPPPNNRKKEKFTADSELEKFRQEHGSKVTTAYDLKHNDDVEKKIDEAVDDVYNSVDEYEQQVIEKPTVEEPEEELETERQWQFKTTLAIKDQEIPVIVTVYPDRATGIVEVDEKAVRNLGRRR